jgi:hypothetical protein
LKAIFHNTSLLSPLQLFQTFARTQEEESRVDVERWKRMNTQLLLEEKHVLLKNELGEKLQKKHALELEITKQFEELKRVEISLEKRANLTAVEG